MRSNDEYRQILRLWESGCNKLQITKKTGIPRGTVCDCIRKYGTLQGLEEYLHREQKHHWTVRRKSQEFRVNYAYMLGIYLGDGYIATHPRTYRLRISLDKKYPNIIQRVIDSMQALVPNNGVHTVDGIGCLEVSCYCNDWIEMFPQHGEGVKHKRDIVLEEWQKKLLMSISLSLCADCIIQMGHALFRIKVRRKKCAHVTISRTTRRTFSNCFVML